MEQMGVQGLFKTVTQNKKLNGLLVLPLGLFLLLFTFMEDHEGESYILQYR